MLHWDGASWSKVAVPSPPSGGALGGLTADPSGGLWASGVAYQPTTPSEQPLVLHESGGTWTAVAPPPLSGGGFLDAVASVSATDVWAGGTQGPSIDPLLEHWNGSGWSLVSLPSSEIEIGADAALPDGHVWVSGSSLHSLMQACGV